MKIAHPTIWAVLLAAAAHAEATGSDHPIPCINAVTICPQQRADAWRRVCEACGEDYLDLSTEEVIDELVAAAAGRSS